LVDVLRRRTQDDINQIFLDMADLHPGSVDNNPFRDDYPRLFKAMDVETYRRCRETEIAGNIKDRKGFLVKQTDDIDARRYGQRPGNKAEPVFVFGIKFNKSRQGNTSWILDLIITDR
jgi:hypothetical protein